MIVDATIVGAPSSTKKKDKARPRDASDEEGPALVPRHEAAHLRGQSNGLTRSAAVAAANIHDKHALPDLLHGDEQREIGRAHV